MLNNKYCWFIIINEDVLYICNGFLLKLASAALFYYHHFNLTFNNIILCTIILNSCKRNVM